MNTITATIVDEKLQELIDQIRLESNRLEGCRLRIGRLLLIVKENGWFMETHQNFFSWVEDTFGWKRSYAYMMIQAHETQQKVGKIEKSTNGGQPIITNERQARALVGVKDKDLPKVIEKAKEIAGGDKPPTANQLQQAREEVVPPKKKQGREVPDAFRLGDRTIRDIGPFIKKIDELARINGGKGKWHKQAEDAMEAMLEALSHMRDGEK